MKNQYFGDINDYRKFGLLRVLAAQSRILVDWMLTPDDTRSDGQRTSYLTQPERWGRYDPGLYSRLQGWLLGGGPRGVKLFEESGLLPGAAFFSEPVPDGLSAREARFRAVLDRAQGFDVVFLDPDNGMEVPSTPMGRAGSSRYARWVEAAQLFARGHSLLLYQHFPRRRREEFGAEVGARLAREVGLGSVVSIRTPHVLFLLASQRAHEHRLGVGVEQVCAGWGGQFLCAPAGGRGGGAEIANGQIANGKEEGTEGQRDRGTEGGEMANGQMANGK